MVVSRSDKTFGPKEFGQMVSVPSYHTTCYKNYTAFRKRPLSGASENPAPLKIRRQNLMATATLIQDQFGNGSISIDRYRTITDYRSQITVR